MVRNVGKLGIDNSISSNSLEFHERLKKSVLRLKIKISALRGRGIRWGARFFTKKKLGVHFFLKGMFFLDGV